MSPADLPEYRRKMSPADYRRKMFPQISQIIAEKCLPLIPQITAEKYLTQISQITAEKCLPQSSQIIAGKKLPADLADCRREKQCHPFILSIRQFVVKELKQIKQGKNQDENGNKYQNQKNGIQIFVGSGRFEHIY
jgi:hypothetical protein